MMKNRLMIYGLYGVVVICGKTAGVCLTAFVCGFCFTKGAVAAAPPRCCCGLFFDKGEKK